jgi:hypothetical protein
MNLLARILSHGFALAVVVLIGVALMYRGDLFPEWQLPEFLVIEDDATTGTDAASGAADSTPPDAAAAVIEPPDTAPAEVPQVEVAQDVAPPAEEAVADLDTATTESGPAAPPVVEDEAATVAVPEEPVVEMADTTPETAVATGTDATGSVVPDEVDQDEVAETVLPASDTTSEAVTEQAEDTQLAPSVTGTSSAEMTEQLESPAQEVAAPMPAADPVADAAPEPESAPEPEPAPEPAVAEMPVAPAGDSDGKSAYAILAAAREAYWLHNLEMAETYYQQLIQLEPDNPDGYGELGNMYFAQGQWEQAATAYYEAGVRLLEAGMLVQARQMVNVIRGLNGVQADELEKQINAAS